MMAENRPRSQMYPYCLPPHDTMAELAEQYNQFMAMLREYHHHRTAVMTALARREIAQTIDQFQRRDNP